MSEIMRRIFFLLKEGSPKQSSKASLQSCSFHPNFPLIHTRGIGWTYMLFQCQISRLNETRVFILLDLLSNTGGW